MKAENDDGETVPPRPVQVVRIKGLEWLAEQRVRELRERGIPFEVVDFDRPNVEEADCSDAQDSRGGSDGGR